MIRLRQVAFVAADLEPVVADLEAVLDMKTAFRDPGIDAFGLHNAVMPVGDTFLEVVSPIREGTTAGRYLERRRGDGGYMVILQLDDLDAARQRVDDLGIRVVWKADHDDIRGTHLHPKDTGGAILSLDWANPPGSWRWAGPDWETANGAGGRREVAVVEVQSDGPAKLATRWGEILDRPLDDDLVIRLDRGAIRFVDDTDGRGEGVSGVDVLGVDAAAAARAEAGRRGLPVDGDVVTICGVRIRVM